MRLNCGLMGPAPNRQVTQHSHTEIFPKSNTMDVATRITEEGESIQTGSAVYDHIYWCLLICALSKGRVVVTTRDHVRRCDWLCGPCDGRWRFLNGSY